MRTSAIARPGLFTLLVALAGGPSHAGNSYWTRHTLGGGGAECAIAVDPRDSRVAYVTTDLGGILKTTNGGEEWFPINSNIGNGNLFDVELDPLNPDIVYTAAVLNRSRSKWSKEPPNGELYRSRDGGRSWENLWSEGENGRRAFGIGSTVQVPNILILHNPGNPRQFDKNGNRLSDVILIGGYDRFKGEPTDVRAGIWRSRDEGKTFEQVAMHKISITCLYQHPRTPAILYAGGMARGLWRSADHGWTWEPLENNLSRMTVYNVKIRPGTDTLFVCTSKGIYKGVDRAETFERVEITSLAFRRGTDFFKTYSARTLLFDNQDKTHNTIVAGIHRDKTWIKMIRSTDGGATWKRDRVQTIRSVPWVRHGMGGVFDIQQASDGRIYAATGGTAYTYEPAGAIWQVSAKGIGNIVINDVKFEPGNPATVYLGMADCGPWKSADKGKTWRYIGDDFRFPDQPRKYVQVTHWAIPVTHPNLVYATGYIGTGTYTFECIVSKSEDAGETWTPIMDGLPPSGSTRPHGTWRTRGLAVDPTNPEIVYAALQLKKGGGAIYRTLNGGRRWEQVHKMGTPYAGLAVSRTGGVVVCAGTGKVVHIGRNNGKDWEKSSVIDPNLLNIFGIDISPTDPNRICVGVNVQGAYLTKDGGKTWTHILQRSDLEPFSANVAISARRRKSYNSTIRAVKFDPTNPDTIYLGHSPGHVGVGILKTTDSGKTWSQFSDSELFYNKIKTIDIDAKGENIVAAGLEAYYYHHEKAQRSGTPTSQR